MTSVEPVFANLEEPIVLVETTTSTITKYRYALTEFVPHTEVSFHLYCYDESDKLVKHIMGKIEGEEYIAWGADDTYIDDLMKAKVSALHP